jgi:hypothetical protein
MKHKQKMKKSKRKLKERVMIHYSGNPPKCGKCGNQNLENLTIDHIFNDGAEKRREDPLHGKNICRWLEENGLPKGYQVLCEKCNEEKKRDLKIYLMGKPPEPLTEERLRAYCQKYGIELEIKGEICILNGKSFPLKNLVFGTFHVPKPIQEILGSGKWKGNHISLITEDYANRSNV